MLEFILEEDKASAFLWQLHVRAFMRPEVSDWVGVALGENAVRMQHHYGAWAVDSANWSAMSASVLSRLLGGTLLSADVAERTRRIGSKAVALSDAVLADDLAGFGAPALWQRMDDLYDAMSELTGLGFIANVSDFHDFRLSGALRSILENRLSDSGLSVPAASVLNDVVATGYRSEAVKENIELLDLAALASATFPEFPSRPQAFFEAVQGEPELSSALSGHWRKWSWVDHGYRGPAYTRKDFSDQVFQVLSRGNFSEEKSRLSGMPASIRERQTELESALGLSESDMVLVRAARDFMFCKAYRVDVRNKAYGAFSALLDEIGRRTGYSKNQLHEADLPEIRAIFFQETSAPTTAMLSSREPFSVWWTMDGRLCILSGSEAASFASRNMASHVDEKTIELCGQTACPGKATGAVRIVRTVADCAKVNAGDILVAPMTLPDFLPAMNRAAAFVTDTGGITCHAAIVARELNKPCVIGTKHATRTFSDGDVVFVDADCGVVRRA